MYKKYKILALIRARGGSKGLVDKNILNLDKKPLISYSIEIAKKIDIVDKVVVNSDSDIILDIANKYKNIDLLKLI